MGNQVLRGVGQLSRRRLFGRAGQIGLALAGSAVATAILGPITAFASGCLDCIGACVCPGEGASTCRGVDVFGGFVYCTCNADVIGTCVRPFYNCALDQCGCTCCC